MSQLTPEQAQAASLRGIAVGVSAGAGSGKTRVLTERFLAELEEALRALGQPSRDWHCETQKVAELLHQLVAVTFTRRAARELSQRVRRRCEEQVRRGGSLVHYWLSLWRLLDFARIGTIHNFCAELLRHYAIEAGIDPAFQVLDDAAGQILTAQVVDDLLREKLAKCDPILLDLAPILKVDELGKVLAELVSERWRWSMTKRADDYVQGLPQRWVDLLGRWRAKLLTEFIKSQSFQEVKKIAEEHCPSSGRMEERCKNITKAAQFLESPEVANKGETEIAEKLQSLLQNATLAGLGKSHGWSSEISGKFRDAAREVRERCEKLRGLFEINLTEFDEKSKSDFIAKLKHLVQICRLACEAISRYEALKKQQSFLDFSDLVGQTRVLMERLQDECRLPELADKIRLLLVDEFQDTDRDQEALVRTLCGPKIERARLFFVGDVKQSIYRFRRADPRVFHRLREDISREGRVTLTKNFRSQPGVLYFVNVLFADAFGKDYEPLEPTRPQLNPEPIVEFLWAVPEAKQEDESSPEDKFSAEKLRELEAQALARRLRRMFDTNEQLVTTAPAGETTCELRPVRPGDVAILFQALSDIDLYEKALRQWQIDYYLVGGQAFYAQQEIYDLLNLLRAVSDPADAVSLAGALRSPFFSCDDQVLWWLGKAPGGLIAAFYSDPLPTGLSQEQKAAVTRAREIICALRHLKDRISIAELIHHALQWTGYDALLLTEFLGERKLANLKKLIELAREFDRFNWLGLDAYMGRLSDYVKHQSKEAPAPLFWETADVVRLMTVHQAKGLEFPVVIVADLNRSFRGAREKVFFSEEGDPYVTYKNAPEPLNSLVKSFEQEEDLRELIRLFYVACTRACDYLILSSALASYDKLKGPWINLVAQKFCLQNGKLLTAAKSSQKGSLVKIAADSSPPDPPERSQEKKLGSGELLAEFDQPPSQDSKDLLAYLAEIPPNRDARRELSFTTIKELANRPEMASSEATKTEDHSPTAVRGIITLAPSEEDREEAAEGFILEVKADEPGPRRVVGLFVHEVLRWLDFDRPDEIRTWMNYLRPSYDNLPEDIDPIQEMIERFLDSPRGRSLAKARRLYREVDFTLPWPSGGSAKGSPYFRGVIDCLYEDDSGHWVILDYKTNDVSGDMLPAEISNENELPGELSHYPLQLRLYALACQDALGILPKELVLYFLRPGRECKVLWDETSRQQTEEFLKEVVKKFRP